MVAARLANLKQGRPKKTCPLGTLSQEDITNEDAAKRMDIGTRTVLRAQAVLSKAVPDVVRMVDEGELSLRAGGVVNPAPPTQRQRDANAAAA
jgi:hypothetical protein